MSLLYYLPEIIFAALAGIALIWGVLFIRDMLRSKKGEVTCICCKAAAKVCGHPYLFLIPVSFGEKYEDAENYLRSHMRPIMDKKEIPAGQRACRTEIYSCSRCDKRQVVITDFLQVRGEEYVKGSYVFACEPFRHLLEEWDDRANMW